MGGSPTATRRRLAIELARLREERHLTCQQVGHRLNWSGSKVNRMETGQGRVQPSDVDALCRFYDTPEELRRFLMGLAKDSKVKGWWHAYGEAIPPWFAVYVGLEQAASGLRNYQCEFVPGLLQTSAYARELHRATSQESREEIERFVAVRLERQALLGRADPPDLWAVIHESVLRHLIGDPGVMREQYERLLEMGERANVTVQVLPFNAGAYPATGAFTVLSFPEQGDPDVVYRDGLSEAVYLDRSEDVAGYTRAFDNLRACALSPAKSAAMIEASLKELVR